MSLRTKSIGVIIVFLLLLLIVALFPTPASMGIAVLLSTILIMYQVFIVLKDAN